LPGSGICSDERCRETGPLWLGKETHSGNGGEGTCCSSCLSRQLRHKHPSVASSGTGNTFGRSAHQHPCPGLHDIDAPHREQHFSMCLLSATVTKAKGADSLSRSRPLDPIFEDPVRSPNHNFVIAKSRGSHKLRGSLSLPFPRLLHELSVCAIRRRPVSWRLRESRRRFSWWPKSTLSLEDCSSVELNNTRVPHGNCGI
jgi:hypothetical protein